MLLLLLLLLMPPPLLVWRRSSNWPLPLPAALRPSSLLRIPMAAGGGIYRLGGWGVLRGSRGTTTAYNGPCGKVRCGSGLGLGLGRAAPKKGPVSENQFPSPLAPETPPTCTGCCSGGGEREREREGIPFAWWTPPGLERGFPDSREEDFQGPPPFRASKFAGTDPAGGTVGGKERRKEVYSRRGEDGWTGNLNGWERNGTERERERERNGNGNGPYRLVAPRRRRGAGGKGRGAGAGAGAGAGGAEEDGWDDEN